MGQFFCLLAGLIVNMGKKKFCCSYRSVLQFLRLLLKIGETPCAVIAMMCGPCFFGLDEIPFARTEEMPFYKTSASTNAQLKDEESLAAEALVLRSIRPMSVGSSSKFPCCVVCK